MSPTYMVNLNKLRHDAKMFDRAWGNFERMLRKLTPAYHDIRNNERLLVSRNKREGWYMQKVQLAYVNRHGGVTSNAVHIRVHDKAWALRYRKQTGAQIVRVKGLG